MKKILGISAFYHDSAAAIVVGGEIVAAAQEERFIREKHTAKFPVNSIKYCLDEAGFTIDELDAIVFYDKPFLKFERLLQTYLSFAPKGLVSFLKSIPIWLNEKLYFKKLIFDGLKRVGDYDKKSVKLLFTEHHLSHAASAFFPSPFERAAILTIDGVGEWCTASIGSGVNGTIKILKEMEFPHSVGLLYSSFTHYLGFKVNSGEYKLMGLAPFGDPYSKETNEFINIIKSVLVDIKEDGSVWLNQGYFNYSIGLNMTQDTKWEKLFGFTRRDPESDLQQCHCNLALAIQRVTEEIVLKMAIEAKRITGADYLCMAGGVALNCLANSRLLSENVFKEMYIQPAAGDSGGAIGAALAASFIYFEEARNYDGVNDGMRGAYLGPDYSEKEIQSMNKMVKSVFTKYKDFSDLSRFIAAGLSKGEIVGWFQGKMEFGPRALGNRSILADPRNPDMQKKLNLKIKFREGFRPFSPSVLSEDILDYFDFKGKSPYMLFVASVSDERRKELPKHYNELSLWEKLYQERSVIPSVTHVDFSSRIQSVHKDTNQRYWELIKEFKKQTGYGLVLNTSFNVRGEPMVCTPYDAYCCFMNTEMDYLVIGNFVYSKKDQPGWENKEKWKLNYKPD